MNNLQKQILSYFGLSQNKTTPKGWYMGGECPWCGKSDKFGIRFNNVKISQYKNHISFNCFHGSCQEKGTEFKLLKKIGLFHLLKDITEYIENSEIIENKIITKHGDEISLELPNMELPYDFNNIEFDEYLDSRGFEDWQYSYYNIGLCEKSFKLKNYVVFLILENGKNKGYLARSKKSSDWIKNYNLKAKEKDEMIHLRYINESGVDFNKLLFGYDEITSNTKTVILVEGAFDKTNVDKLLNVNLYESIKCCSTFGNKVSIEQILKLKIKESVKNIILMYDPGTIEESKQYGIMLSHFFDNVEIANLKDKDPGELNFNELNVILNNLESPFNFYYGKLQKKLKI